MLTWFRSLGRLKHFPLALIAVANFALHLAVIARPAGLVFDENYYVIQARGIMAGWGQPYPDHPPLGKLFIISGMRLFGDNPFGWRLLPILFGTASIVLFYFICADLKMSRKAQVAGTFLLAFENLTFLQAGIAMLDVFSVTLMLGAFLLYLRTKNFAGGLSLALSALAKLTGVLGGVTIFFHWLLSKRRRVWPFVALAVTAIASFLLLLPVLNYALSHAWNSPISLLRGDLAANGRVVFTTVVSQGTVKPLSWVLDPGAFFYIYDPQYVAVVTPTIWVVIIPSVLYLLYKAIKGSNAAVFGLAWFAATYLLWIPTVMITGRLTYLYYLYPAIGAICLGLGIGISDLLESTKAERAGISQWLTPAVTYGYLAVHFALFLVLSPVFLPLVRWFPVR